MHRPANLLAAGERRSPDDRSAKGWEPPFAGEGANLALQNGAALGLVTVAHGSDVDVGLATCEAEMSPRAEASTAHFAAGLDLCFDADAPGPLVDFVLRFGMGRVAQAA